MSCDSCSVVLNTTLSQINGIDSETAMFFKSTVQPARIDFKLLGGGKYKTLYKLKDDLRQVGGSGVNFEDDF